MKLVLHIDRLVLRGVPPDQRDAVVADLHAALQREFARPGVAESWSGLGHRAALRVRPGFHAVPGQLGAAAATALTQGVRDALPGPDRTTP